MINHGPKTVIKSAESTQKVHTSVKAPP